MSCKPWVFLLFLFSKHQTKELLSIFKPLDAMYASSVDFSWFPVQVFELKKMHLNCHSTKLTHVTKKEVQLCERLHLHSLLGPVSIIILLCSAPWIITFPSLSRFLQAFFHHQLFALFEMKLQQKLKTAKIVVCIVI